MEPTIVTSCQLRMARAALRMSLAQFAEESGVGERTLRRIEGQPLIEEATTDTLFKIRAAIERLGFVLVDANHPSGNGPGLFCDRAYRRIVERERSRSDSDG